MKRRHFITLAGSSAAWVAAAPVGRDLLKTGALDEKELKNRSFAAFDRFRQVWDFNDFWKRGNTFDACLTFADALQQKWPDDPKVRAIQQQVRDMLEENLTFFASYDPGTLWADDFGWWGLLALNGRKHLQKMGETSLAVKYLELSTEMCWEYKKNTAYDHTDSARPVPHGCRNGDANGNSRGVKNTVTNVLLFLLSSRIYRMSLAENLPDNTKYLDMAYRQWKWFESWFQLEEYEYLKKINPSAALVQERPMAFFEGSDYQEKIHPPWAEGWVWTGDQGMLVAALTDMIAVRDELAQWLADTGKDPSFDKEAFATKAREYISLIGKGVKIALVSQQDQIIREAPCYSSFGPEHGRDYVAGRGIMLRYLGAEEEKKLLGVDLSENIRATVEAIWQTRDKSNDQFQPEFTSARNDRRYIEQFRQLWGLADDLREWSLDTMIQKNKNGVCQSVGLDALGAAVRMV